MKSNGKTMKSINSYSDSVISDAASGVAASTITNNNDSESVVTTKATHHTNEKINYYEHMCPEVQDISID